MGTPSNHHRQLDSPGYLKKLLAAGTYASELGIAILDSQTRFESVNSTLAGETRASVNGHIGRTSREIVGDLATQIEPTYEKVLRTGKSASVLLKGHVRETPEFGYWLDECFPIVDKSGRVQQLGLFVVNVTAEKASREILDSLALDSKVLRAGAAGLIEKFDEAIRHYHLDLRRNFKELACPFTEPARKVDRFRGSVERLDEEIREMRQLIYALISQFSIPAC
jgi:hypothetical protein